MPDTTPDPAAELAKDAMWDVLYGAMLHDRFDSSEEALAALMPVVDRYVAAHLRRIAGLTTEGFVRRAMLRHAADLEARNA